MPSKQTEELKNLYLNWAAALTANPEMQVDEMRDIASRNGWEIMTTEPGGVDYLETKIETDAGGVPAMWVVPKGGAEDRVVLCLHGGGFITGSMYTHRKLFGHIAKAIGARALIPHYRLAPEHVHPAQVDDAVAAYRWLLDQGIKAKHIALTGDSAGGGLSITTMLRAHEQGLPLPAASMPFSPWVDMEATGETMLSNDGKDALFTKAMVEGLVSMFLGEGGNRRDPHANPLYADLTGLPPVYIQVGDQELLLDDSRQLAKHAQKAGVDVRLDVFPGQQHTFQAAAGRAPEADEAIHRLADWVRPKLGLADAA
jgi:epsilon-lactone hydrolase